MFNPEGGFMAGMGAFPSLTTKFMYENDDGLCNGEDGRGSKTKRRRKKKAAHANRPPSSTKRARLTALPDELVGCVMACVRKQGTISDVVSCMGVCRQWRRTILSTPAVWHHIAGFDRSRERLFLTLCDTRIRADPVTHTSDPADVTTAIATTDTVPFETGTSSVLQWAKHMDATASTLPIPLLVRVCTLPTHLTRLHISDAKINRAALMRILESCVDTLEDLDVSSREQKSTLLNGPALLQLSMCVTLSHLDMQGNSRVSDRMFACLKTCTLLKQVDISYTGLSLSSAVMLLNSCPGLITLIARGCSMMSKEVASDGSWQSMMTRSQPYVLSTMDVLDSPVGAFQLSSLLHRTPNMRHLTLGGNHDAALAGHFFARAAPMARSASACRIHEGRGEGAEDAGGAGLPLRNLRIPQAKHIHAESLKQLLEEASTSLRQLSLAYSHDINDTVLSWVTMFCPNITELDISGTNVTDHGVDMLMQAAKSLTSFRVDACRSMSRERRASICSGRAIRGRSAD